MKIYLAGASEEVDQVRNYMTLVRDLGHEITHDWTELVLKQGGNPREVSEERQQTWCLKDIQGVAGADLLWLLLPESRNSFGAAFEFGFAYAIGAYTAVSGDWKRTIFSSCASRRFDSHALAFGALRSGNLKP